MRLGELTSTFTSRSGNREVNRVVLPTPLCSRSGREVMDLPV